MRVGVAAGLALLVAVAGCAVGPQVASPGATSPGAPPVKGSHWRLDFDGPDALALAGGFGVVQALPVDGGSYQVVDGPAGGRALAFPSFASGAGLALVDVNEAGTVPDPGGRDFGWGADVRSDSFEVTEADDGDNLLQRGLAADPHQYKLQLDGGRPSCVVAGTAGRLVAKAATRLEARWYRLRCERQGESLVLTVVDLQATSPEAVTVAVQGPVGAVTFPTGTPLSVGRKVSPSGKTFASQPDQFNGVLDAVWVGLS